MLNDEPKSNANLKMNGLDLSCLNGVKPELQKIFEGNVTDTDEDRQEIDLTWNCIDHALVVFSRNTHGSDPEYYSANELQKFANRYLPEDKIISSSFVNSIFRLKFTILGGSDQRLSRPEIELLRVKLRQFGTILRSFAPYIGTIVRANDSSDDAKHLTAKALDVFSTDLATVLGDCAYPVLWTDLIFFIKSLDDYTRNGSSSALTHFREQFPLFQYAKVLIVGGNEESIETGKWKPLLQIFSHVYGSLFLKTSLLALFSEFSRDVESTDLQQQNAVRALTRTLIRMKNDPSVTSVDTIRLMSDSWGKLLLLNSVLFPEYENSLGIAPFLNSVPMQELAGLIINDLTLYQESAGSTSSLRMLCDHVMSLLAQHDPISISRVQSFLESLDPLFTKTNDAKLISSFLSLLKVAIPIMIGRNDDQITVSDLKPLIEKAFDLNAVWRPVHPTLLPEKIGATADIIERAPAPSQIRMGQVLEATRALRVILTDLKIVTNFDWDKTLDTIQKGFNLKGTLFSDSNERVTHSELTKLSILWEPFRRNPDLSVAFSVCARSLKDHPFDEVQIGDLLSFTQSLLSEEYSHYFSQYNIDVFKQLKRFLIGGSSESLSPDDYSSLFANIGAFYETLVPKIRELPSHFQFGLNAESIELSSEILDAIAKAPNTSYSISNLKELIRALTHGKDYQIRESTLNSLLAGAHTRILSHSKNQKPNGLDGLVFDPSDLKVFKPLLASITASLADLQRAFDGLNIETELLSRSELESRESDPTILLLLKNIQPLIDGTEHLHHLRTRGMRHDLYTFYDLAFKSIVYNAAKWIIPYYKISHDPDQTRLSLDDLTDLMTDLTGLIFDLGLTLKDLSPFEAAKARMKNMDLFTQVGNGNQFMEPLEAVEFMSLTSGNKITMHTIEDILFPACFPNLPTNKIKSIPYSCLTKFYFTKDFQRKIFGEVIPELVNQFEKFTPDEIESYRVATFATVNPQWSEGGDISMGDFETLVSLPSFLENIFERFDVNDDDSLHFTEIMKGFPVFCREIQSAAKTKIKGSCEEGQDPNQIEAIYGYLIFNGHAPDSGGSLWQRIRTTADLLLWFYKWNHLNRDPVIRDQNTPFIARHDLLGILSSLSATEADQ